MNRPIADETDFKAAMRRLASGVAIVTTECEGSFYGLTATSVTSLSVDPPSLLVCVDRSASAHDPIRRSGKLCVNLLGSSQRHLSQRFAGACASEQRFDGVPWRVEATGAPVLEGSVASFDCELMEVFQAKTHSIFVGLVLRASVGGTEPPLVYVQGGYTQAVP